MFMQQLSSSVFSFLVFFCTPLTSNFHFYPVEEASSAKKKALSVCDLHMVLHKTQRKTGIFFEMQCGLCMLFVG